MFACPVFSGQYTWPRMTGQQVCAIMTVEFLPAHQVHVFGLNPVEQIGLAADLAFLRMTFAGHVWQAMRAAVEGCFDHKISDYFRIRPFCKRHKSNRRGDGRCTTKQNGSWAKTISRRSRRRFQSLVVLGSIWTQCS